MTQPIVDSAIFKYLSEKGKDAREIARIIGLTSDTELLNKCAAGQVLDHVNDIRAFVKGLSTLKDKPFCKVDYGEDMDNAYYVRSALASCLDIVDTDRMLDYTAWALWQKHKCKMYISSSTAYGYCHRLQLDPKSFFKFVHRHRGLDNVLSHMVTHKDLYYCEESIMTFLRNVTNLGLTVPLNDSLDKHQNDAIQCISKTSRSALQGSAGCGKTTSIAHLVNHICRQTNVVCLAFTHKAKRCIKQKLNNEEIQVSTIHSFIHGTRNGPPIDEMFLLVDECSMLDIELLAELCSTVIAKCQRYQVCFVGDDQQLPPIGRGEFFREYITENDYGINRLTKCYRTDRPDLFAAFEKIRNGEMPASTDNFEVISCGKMSLDFHVKRIIDMGVADHTNVQFIAWQNKDVFKINQWVQARRLQMGLIGPQVWRGFYKEDRVIYKGENKDGLTNAMVGRVEDIPSTGGVRVRWEDNTSTLFTKDVAMTLFLGYCFTAHSSQGSEYNTAIVPVYDVEKMRKCLDRRWFYTAVTRAQTKAIVIASDGIQDYVGRPLAPLPHSGMIATLPSEAPCPIM